MFNQNDLLNRFGGIFGIQNRLTDFSKEFSKTGQTPQEVGKQIQQQMSPEQFQMFAAIADAVVGKKH